MTYIPTTRRARVFLLAIIPLLFSAWVLAQAPAAPVNLRITSAPPTGGSCEPPNCWVRETNTGWQPTGVTLTPLVGNQTITVNGTVIDGRDVQGCITVNANNVTIKRSRVTCSGDRVILSNGTNLLVENVEVICTGPASGDTNGISFDNHTSRYNNVHGCENGIWAADNSVVEYNWIHDGAIYDDQLADPPHTDGVQSGFGDSNIIIRKNRIEMGGSNRGANAAITAGGSPGPDNYLAENNLLSGAGFTFRCEITGGNKSNYRVLNNRFSNIFNAKVGFFGPEHECSGGQHGVVFTGNVCHETGQALSTCD